MKSAIISINTSMLRLLVATFVTVAPSGIAAIAGAPLATTSEIAGVFAAHGAHVTQSILVRRLSDGHVLFEKDPDQLVSPASVTKVVTSAAALARFSPVHTFKTGFYHTGTRRQERLAGDLVIVGDGDPFFVSEKLWQAAADLRHLGIREVTGDLVIDNSLFDAEVRDSSRQGTAKWTRNAYDAPVTAFAVNFNTFAVAIAPGEQVGKPAVIGLDPYPLKGVTINGEVRTVKETTGKSVQVSRSGTENGDDRLSATGVVAVSAPLTKVYRSVGDPVQVSGEYVKAFLRNEGIAVRGVVKAGRLPQTATEIMAVESFEMRRIVAGLNTFSNNFIADVLVKRLGAAFPREGEPDRAGSGNFANGVAVLADFLRRDVGITSPYILENGSGLATENRLTARQVVEILAYMERRMDLFPDFLASLPATGWDGTLKKRLKSGAQAELTGLIRAKSGTLSEPISVASLAGYFRHKSHGLVAFCILENGVSGKGQPSVHDLRVKQDQALAAMMAGL